MSFAEFKSELLSSSANALASLYLKRERITAFATVEAYEAFKAIIQNEVQGSASVAIVGTGNWQYSLNPEKAFKEFDENSDIDVAVVSSERFHGTWNQLREFHRLNWWTIPYYDRLQLRRNGENVYCGFVTPAWIPDRRSPHRYAHKSMLNRLSQHSPGRREVKIMYFKDEAEALDYYQRGFAIGQKRVSSI